MSKFFKLGLVLSVLAFSMIACVKPISTIGTYKSGDYTMTISSSGYVSFGYIGTKKDSELKPTDSVENSLRYILGGGIVTPWDLGAVSTAASYELKGYERTYGDNNDQKFTPVATLKFKTDTQKVTCDVELTGVPEAVGKNGKVTFTK